ncbi:unnamed protein product [Spirodela intermedia]|uniref:phosphoserine phosphatase n=1 Tax=Spirodela intermedia TaxID=51605 RepID=A0A7I8JDP6_SPIIN|nr:unnamed protein product [Spirodela intermedia]CAA6668294.1 unnamed protein product [Spirodela intermedia]
MAEMIRACFIPNYPSSHHQRLGSLFPPAIVKASYKFPSWKLSNSPLKLVASSVQSPKTMASTQFGNTLPSKDVLEIWRSADAVCFDVDSTVCLDEGIDELADFCGAGEAVAEWTARAMTGSVPFEEALAARLSIFNPSLSQLHNFLEKRPPRISPGIQGLIEKLRSKKTEVYLISGGFRQMIEPVAAHLGIPRENIYANRLLFRSSGEFLGFDAEEPTSRSGGKATAVQNLRAVHKYGTLVMIGDGATDLEAKQPGGADLFICYGGVQLRAAVAAAADWLVLDFEDLCAGLE